MIISAAFKNIIPGLKLFIKWQTCKACMIKTQNKPIKIIPCWTKDPSAKASTIPVIE